MTKRTSRAYVFTADVNSVTDMQAIQIVRKTVATSNRISRLHYQNKLKWNPNATDLVAPKQHRVVLKPRLGKNNPAYDAKYKNQWIKSIKLEDAVRIDVYVHSKD